MNRFENWQDKYYEKSVAFSSALTLCGLVAQGIAAFNVDIDGVNGISYMTVPCAMYTISAYVLDRTMREKQSRKRLEEIKLSGFPPKRY
ncbi:MAG: hypothetical protein ABIF40_06035 [archaeon]